MAKIAAFFTAWSMSRFKDWLKCPRFAHWSHNLKKPTGPKPPAMLRGGEIHKRGERYFQIEPREFAVLPAPERKLYEKVGVINRLKALPAEYKAFKKEMEELRKGGATSEGQRAMDKSWGITDWFGPLAWCRIVYDAKLWVKKALRVRIVDFKTGQIYPDDNDEQMELYAITGFSEHPEAVEVVTELWYLDQPRNADAKSEARNPRVRTFKQKDMPKLRKKWEARVKPMMADRRYLPTPGRQCSWCPYSKRKGGECEY